MAVGDYDLQPFTSPVGADPQAWQTRNNDNLLRAKFNAHQADEVAHVQSGLASAKPASGTATGEVYIATDTGQVWIWSGSAWVSYSSGGGSPSWTSELVEVIWGTPSKSGTDYTIAATSQDVSGASLSTDEIGVMVIVSDGAADAEPSATATISAASPAVGTLLAGSGTATAVFKTNASGQFSIRVTESATSVSRYVWVRAGGHFQRFVKARDGIVSLSY